jgi:hypothetical protein
VYGRDSTCDRYGATDLVSGKMTKDARFIPRTRQGYVRATISEGQYIDCFGHVTRGGCFIGAADQGTFQPIEKNIGKR